ncbi:xanthosine utilization system XapX-like protein [Bradyrhizobium sp. USDA 3311]
MPEEQIWYRDAPPVAVLTVGLMRMAVNYSIVPVAPSAADGLRLAVPRAHGLVGKTRESG